jgi:glycosyltransferase involved in cell wall biosynthesis
LKLLLVSDAWAPQVNGVVRTLATTVEHVRAQGHEVETVTPDQFRTFACPSYREIRLAIGSGRAVTRRIEAFAPDAIHIATEGPLGWAARGWCMKARVSFTTAFHTRFPDYVAMRTGVSPRLIWPIVRRFHRPATRIFAATDTLARELTREGLGQTHRWSRGVDLDLFSPDADPLAALCRLPRPIQLCVGRVAVEKNIEAFLASDVGGTKVVVGEGPALAGLRRRHPGAVFLGALHGAALAGAYAAADVLVFPSRTDTFGLVMIEALASGVPVAGYPVPGPLDVLGRDGCGVAGSGARRIGGVDDDLGTAIRIALTADRSACVAEGRLYGWESCTRAFLGGLDVRHAGRVALPH